LWPQSCRSRSAGLFVVRKRGATRISTTASGFPARIESTSKARCKAYSTLTSGDGRAHGVANAGRMLRAPLVGLRRLSGMQGIAGVVRSGGHFRLAIPAIAPVAYLGERRTSRAGVVDVLKVLGGGANCVRGDTTCSQNLRQPKRHEIAFGTKVPAIADIASNLESIQTHNQRG
jgi:hypothetical protein